ncbi:coiled-coil domain-containing protein 55-domain containing protein [Kockiozyma suomiensis]|uniref:coiled-coil domain-containing protein 55-domain containing protein n=1 Tax=Kockiozyma suomiensis TaxID=1337062 RepID=UPI003343B91B
MSNGEPRKFGGLKIQAKKKSGLKTSSASASSSAKSSKRSIFDDDDEDGLEHASSEDDNYNDAATTETRQFTSRSSLQTTNNARSAISAEIAAHSTHNSQIAASNEQELDPSIYAYDDVYDTMKSAERSARERLVEGNEKERKSKYISTLQDSLKMRTQDRLLARDKLNKREREEEGDEFSAAPVFESAAFKRQKAELEKVRMEEEELEEKERRRKKGGLVGVYQKILKESEGSHEAQVRAAAAAASLAKPKR